MRCGPGSNRSSGNTRNSPGKGWGSRLVPLLDEQLGYYRPALMVLFGAVGPARDRRPQRRLAAAHAGAGARARDGGPGRARRVTPAAREAADGRKPGPVCRPAPRSGSRPPPPHCPSSSADARRHPAAPGSQRDIHVRSRSASWLVTVTTVFFGLLPALILLRRQMTVDLKSGERGSSRGARRLYSVLVTAEVALACALLVSSVLLVRTVQPHDGHTDGRAAPTRRWSPPCS